MVLLTFALYCFFYSSKLTFMELLLGAKHSAKYLQALTHSILQTNP
jgi:hypothetical protein